MLKHSLHDFNHAQKRRDRGTLEGTRGKRLEKRSEARRARAMESDPHTCHAHTLWGTAEMRCRRYGYDLSGEARPERRDWGGLWLQRPLSLTPFQSS